MGREQFTHREYPQEDRVSKSANNPPDCCCPCKVPLTKLGKIIPTCSHLMPNNKMQIAETTIDDRTRGFLRASVLIPEAINPLFRTEKYPLAIPEQLAEVPVQKQSVELKENQEEAVDDWTFSAIIGSYR